MIAHENSSPESHRASFDCKNGATSLLSCIWPPCDIACDFGIRRVRVEDIIGVGHARSAEHKAARRDYLRRRM